MMPAAKPKTCKSCRTKFVPVRPLQVVCGFTCAMAHADKAKARATATEALKAARAHREAKVKAKTRAQWMKEAQASFNRWVRLRDADLPCISSGRHHTGQYHAGHYRSTAAAPQLRFNPDNVHKQSSCDNNHKSGNIVEYRINLIKKIGLDRVEALENDNTSHHWTIEDLREIKARYTAMAKAIDKSK